MNRSNKIGMSVAEVLVAASLITIVMSMLSGVYATYLRTTLNRVNEVKALFLAEAGIEHLRYIRGTGWDNLIGYGTQTDVIEERYTRVIAVESGQSANDRKVTATVSWAAHGSNFSKSLSTYLGNIYAE